MSMNACTVRKPVKGSKKIKKATKYRVDSFFRLRIKPTILTNIPSTSGSIGNGNNDVRINSLLEDKFIIRSYNIEPICKLPNTKRKEADKPKQNHSVKQLAALNAFSAVVQKQNCRQRH